MYCRLIEKLIQALKVVTTSNPRLPAGSRTQKSCAKPKGVGIESSWEEDIMQAAVVPAVSSSWQIKDVPQPQPEPNQVLVEDAGERHLLYRRA